MIEKTRQMSHDRKKMEIRLQKKMIQIEIKNYQHKKDKL
jgi:hypothetical protein